MLEDCEARGMGEDRAEPLGQRSEKKARGVIDAMQDVGAWNTNRG